MRLWPWPFLALAACGLLLSIVAHVQVLNGHRPPFPDFIWGLHFGIFLVYLPAVLSLGRRMEGHDRMDVLRVAFKYAPTWLKVLFWVIAIYSFAFGAYSFFTHRGQGGLKSADGDLPDFSAVWMLFYSASLTFLWSAARAPRREGADAV